MDTQREPRSNVFLIFVFGLVIGLLIAGAIALIRSGFNKEGDQQPTTETQGIVLSISRPNDGDVVSTNSTTISGTTGKDAVVAIVGGADDIIVETDGGGFSANINLAEGENNLSVYAFDTDSGESSQTTLNILYLKEELGANNILVAAENTTAAQKARERIEKLRKQLATKSADLKKAAGSINKAHIFGTITSIDSSTFNIETNKAGVKSVFTDEFTKFFSIGKGGRRTIAFENLKVGDKVSVVGLNKDDTSGSAKFVVRLTKPNIKRHAVLGKVKNISGKTLTLTHLIQTDRLFTIQTTNSTLIIIKGQDAATFTDLKIGDVVVASGSVDNSGTITAKHLFVVPGKFESANPKESTKSATPSSR